MTGSAFHALDVLPLRRSGEGKGTRSKPKQPNRKRRFPFLIESGYGKRLGKRMFRSTGRCIQVGSAGYLYKREVWRENGGPSALRWRVGGFPQNSRPSFGALHRSCSFLWATIFCFPCGGRAGLLFWTSQKELIFDRFLDRFSSTSESCVSTPMYIFLKGKTYIRR